MSSRSLSSALVTLACALAVGCGWTLGLGGYSNAPDDGGLSDGIVDQASAPDGSSDATADVLADSLSDVLVSDAPPNECASDPTHACVPAVPSAWQGPYEIFEGTGSPLPAAPACDGLFPTVAFDGKSNPSGLPASCSCTCAGFTGTCGPDTARFRTAASCGPPNCGGGGASLPKGACINVSTDVSTCGAMGVFTNGPTPSGTCTPSATTALPSAFTQEIRACGTGVVVTPQRGCPGTDVCAPKPAPLFEDKNHCVAQSGVNVCPTGYPAQHVYYGGANDSRGCSACSCAVSGVACTSPTVSLWSNTTCSGAPTATSAAPLVCTSSVGTMSMKYSDNGVTGTCGAATAGSPTGSVTPTTPMTFCCTN